MVIIKRSFFSLTVAIAVMEAILSNIYRLPSYWYVIAIVLCAWVALIHLISNYEDAESYTFYEKTLDRMLTTSILMFVYSSVSFISAQFIVSNDFHPRIRFTYYGALLIVSISLFIQYRRAIQSLLNEEE